MTKSGSCAFPLDGVSVARVRRGFQEKFEVLILFPKSYAKS